jgi:hypothetical protein
MLVVVARMEITGETDAAALAKVPSVLDEAKGFLERNLWTFCTEACDADDGNITKMVEMRATSDAGDAIVIRLLHG